MSAIRHAFDEAVDDSLLLSALRYGPVHPLAQPIHYAVARHEQIKPKTKEQARGWAAKLSFKTHRKLVNQGYEVL